MERLLFVLKKIDGGGGDAVADYPILVSFLGGGDRAVIKDN